MSYSFNRSANIRALISKLGCPAAVRECQAAFGQLINPRIRNTFLTDMHAWHSAQVDGDNDLLTVYTNPAEGSTPIPRELYTPLQDFLGFPPKKAKFFRNITMKGVTFSTAKQHLGNSCVLIKDRYGYLAPARITYIVRMAEDCVLIAIQRHKPTEVCHDPYQPYYDILQQRLWSRSVDQLTVVQLSSIVAHFTALKISWENKEFLLVGSQARVRQFHLSYYVALQHSPAGTSRSGCISKLANTRSDQAS